MSTLTVNGMSIVEREAFDLADAVVENITDIRVCMDCNEAAASVARNFSDLLTAASANASNALELVRNEADQEKAVHEFVELVTQVFVVNFTRVRHGVTCIYLDGIRFVRSALLLAFVLCTVAHCSGCWVLLGCFCLLRVTPGCAIGINMYKAVDHLLPKYTISPSQHAHSTLGTNTKRQGQSIFF